MPNSDTNSWNTWKGENIINQRKTFFWYNIIYQRRNSMKDERRTKKEFGGRHSTEQYAHPIRSSREKKRGPITDAHIFISNYARSSLICVDVRKRPGVVLISKIHENTTREIYIQEKLYSSINVCRVALKMRRTYSSQKNFLT